MNTYDIVVKDNKLIHSRYNLNYNETKILLLVVSKINSFSTDDVIRIKTTYQEILSVLKLKKNHHYILKLIRGLMNKELHLFDENTGKVLETKWVIGVIHHNKWDKDIELHIHPDLSPLFLNLKKNFTKYRLKDIIRFTSKYSFRLYEFLKSFEGLGKRIMTIDELKDYLCIGEKYKRFNSFKQEVLEKSIQDINNYSDLNCSYETIYKKIKKGDDNYVRQVSSISFTINSKNKTIEYNNNKLKYFDKLKLSKQKKIELLKLYIENNQETLLKEKIDFILNRNSQNKIQDISSYSYVVLMNTIEEIIETEKKLSNIQRFDLKPNMIIIDLKNNNELKIDKDGVFIRNKEGVVILSEGMIIKYLKSGRFVIKE